MRCAAVTGPPTEPSRSGWKRRSALSTSPSEATPGSESEAPVRERAQRPGHGSLRRAAAGAAAPRLVAPPGDQGEARDRRLQDDRHALRGDGSVRSEQSEHYTVGAGCTGPGHITLT